MTMTSIDDNLKNTNDKTTDFANNLFPYLCTGIVILGGIGSVVMANSLDQYIPGSSFNIDDYIS